MLKPNHKRKWKKNPFPQIKQNTESVSHNPSSYHRARLTVVWLNLFVHQNHCAPEYYKNVGRCGFGRHAKHNEVTNKPLRTGLVALKNSMASHPSILGKQSALKTRATYVCFGLFQGQAVKRWFVAGGNPASHDCSFGIFLCFSTPQIWTQACVLCLAGSGRTCVTYQKVKKPPSQVSMPTVGTRNTK